jgi:uncharacterized repeat protein (TIGR03806 family)
VAHRGIRRTWSCLATLTVVGLLSDTSIGRGTLQRQANTTLQLPHSPPATTYVLENAFGNLAFAQPVAIATPPGETGRVFVNEKGGRIQLVTDIQAVSPQKLLFLDLRSLVDARVTESFFDANEGGLLGLAFHPGYATNRHFFIFYTVSVNGVLHDRVSRMSVSISNPSLADPDSELILFQQLDQAANHNGGDLHFGPTDGYLYIALGDEGGANDQFNNSQKIDADFFAGILRIDVDKRSANLLPNDHSSIVTHNGDPVSNGGIPNYLIPADNPWVGVTAFNGSSINVSALRSEFWAVGLRNPWRFSFDPVSHEMWIGEVGQDLHEEINLGTAGANYGWEIFEADRLGNIPPAGLNHTLPLYSYDHGFDLLEGNSLTGGIVYHGDRHPELRGTYLFADYVSGNIWSLNRSNGVHVTRLLGEGGVATFGSDPANGDVLLGDLDGGEVKRLVKQTITGGFPSKLSETGIFSDLVSLVPELGVVSYEPNLPFWSDHATKSRWFSVPDISDTIVFSTNSNWQMPNGSLWVKHFDLELTRGIPASSVRIETRLIVKNTNGVYGVSYRWNAQGTDADLVEDAGLNIDYQIVENGMSRQQRWSIPSRSECLSCHTAVAGHVLSFNTPQLSGQGNMGGSTVDRLQSLSDAGYFSHPITSTGLLPAYSKADDSNSTLEHRARSYLAVNCGQCHQPGGSASSTWDARFDQTLLQSGLINGGAANDGGNPDWRLIRPGFPLESILLHRMSGTANFERMPNIGTTELDGTGINLVSAWISMLTEPPLALVPSVHRTAGDMLLLRFSEATSQPFPPNLSQLIQIETASELGVGNWSVLPFALTQTNGLLQFEDSVSTNVNRRFYRVLDR